MTPVAFAPGYQIWLLYLSWCNSFSRFCGDGFPWEVTSLIGIRKVGVQFAYLFLIIKIEMTTYKWEPKAYFSYIIFNAMIL